MCKDDMDAWIRKKHNSITNVYESHIYLEKPVKFLKKNNTESWKVLCLLAKVCISISGFGKTTYSFRFEMKVLIQQIQVQ